jgi:hypothetical protein
VAQFVDEDSHALDITAFRDYAAATPRIMFPSYRLQLSMQKASLGVKRWTKIIKGADARRVALAKKKKVLDHKKAVTVSRAGVMESEISELKAESLKC